MNNKEEIENYFLELYKKTKNYSFEKFLETVFHYNIQIGNYNKPIFFDLQKCTLDILKEINTIKPEIKYWNSFGWNNVFVIFNKYFTYYNKIVLDFPIFDYDIDKICPTIIKYIIFNGITSKISFHNINKNPLFKIEIYNIDDVNKIINFFYSNNKISSITKSRVIPLLIQKNYIGIYREYDPFDFKNYYLSKLFEFYNICLEEKDVTISKFRDYLSKIYRFERRPNEKRMLKFLIDYIYQYDNIDNFEKLFILDKDIRINGINLDNYIFIDNGKGNMYFKSKEDEKIIIKYGSMEFLNMIYTKFCNNKNIKEINKIYDDFSGMYDSIISNNFENVDILIDLANNNEKDLSSRIVYIMSSAYFAHKKLNLDEYTINKLLNKLMIKIKNQNN